MSTTAEPNCPRAVVYAAKSSADTHGSIPTQIADCRKAAEAEGRIILAEHQDEGFSAFTGNRGPGLAAAKALAADLAREHGKAELWVQHSDRLARGGGAKPGDADHLVEVWIEMRRSGVQLRSCQDDHALKEIVYVALMGTRNSEDSVRKSKATKAGLRKRVEKGLEHGGGVPAYGYKRVAGRLRQVPHEAAIVQRIYREWVGGVRQQVIARTLTAEGVRTKRGKRWTQPGIHVILANPIYVGNMRVGVPCRKGDPPPEVLPGKHKPIIDAALWGEAQALLTTLSGDRGRPAHGFLLSGRLLRCSCGATMVPRSKGQGRYLCHGRHRDPASCDMPTFPRALVDDAVTRYFTEQLLDRAESRRRAEAVAGEQVAMVREQREQAERAEMAAEAAVQRVERDYNSGALPVERYLLKIEGLEADLAGAVAAAEQARERERLLAETPDLPDVLENLHARLLAPVRDAETTAALRAALRRVFSHFELSAKPPPTLPVAVSADDAATVPEEHISAAEAAAIVADVSETLGVTVPHDGPFWAEWKMYLVPVLLPGIDLGLNVEPWAVVDGVAVGVENYRSARAKV